jgi:hypothetical protein
LVFIRGAIKEKIGHLEKERGKRERKRRDENE